jgi:enoyl-CoA hydratase/carnithine racemase
METLTLKTQKMIGYKEDGVGWMVFNNPERRNAISLDMQEAIPDILGDFAADPAIRVVVMTGAGDRAFVSGADISEFDSRRATPEQIAGYNAIGRRANEAYKALGKPLVAMIRGFCVGGGLLTALRADLLIASEDSQFGVPAVRLGLGYAYEQVKTLVDRVGPAHTRRILLVGDRVDAATALRMGLVNEVVAGPELEGRVKQLASIMAGNAPLTTKAIMASIETALKDESQRDLARLNQLVADCMASEDYKEGRTAFMEKRTPQFQGR